MRIDQRLPDRGPVSRALHGDRCRRPGLGDVPVLIDVLRQIIESDIGLLRARVAQILDGTDGVKLREELEALTHL